jgi:hypothetical protein
MALPSVQLQKHAGDAAARQEAIWVIEASVRPLRDDVLDPGLEARIGRVMLDQLAVEVFEAYDSSPAAHAGHLGDRARPLRRHAARWPGWAAPS